MSKSDLPEYELLLRANLERVFNERDAERRKLAIAELYVEAPMMHEPTATVNGRAAIWEAAGKVHDKFGPDFAFVAEGAVGHHGLACLRWHAGPKNGPPVVRGMDAAEIVDGKIARLWVLLE